ncbi:MAG: T9SS type A sorting domain-containing protein [Saprospiraceae bacterium]
MQFTIIDDQNDGISVYKSSGDAGYTVQEGDYISVTGTIDQYNGLLEILVDGITLINQNNELVSPTVVTQLNEETESQLVKIENVYLKDLTEWKGTGESANITVTDGVNEYLMRIDNDCDLSTAAVPDYVFNLTGIGGQYDNSEPYTDGYQIFPRYASDIDKITKVNNIDNKVNIYPNPASKNLFIEGINNENCTIEVLTVTGKSMIKVTNNTDIDVSNIPCGSYILKVKTDSGVANKLFIKQ